jgi:DNA-binding XRE family transcriptional regulator
MWRSVKNMIGVRFSDIVHVTGRNNFVLLKLRFPMKKPVGVRLKSARESLGFTQKELAEAAKTNQQTIDKIERGITKMPRK